MNRPLRATSIGVPVAVRSTLLRQHGSASQAFSAAYQPGLEHFGDECGFLAYTKVGRTALVLSDPLAPRENIPDLIARFVKEHPDAGFWYLTHPVAEIFARSGFLVNAMGHDTWIDLSTYTFSGAKKEQLRRAVNRMVKRGFVTRECSLTEVGIEKVKAVSDAWRGTRTMNSEVAFLNRPLVPRRSLTCAGSSLSTARESWSRSASSTPCMKGAS